MFKKKETDNDTEQDVSENNIIFQIPGVEPSNYRTVIYAIAGGGVVFCGVGAFLISLGVGFSLIGSIGVGMASLGLLAGVFGYIAGKE